MKIITLKSLILIVCLFGSIAASAYDFKSGVIYYNITSSIDKTVEVSNNSDNSYSGSIVIPTSVTNEGITYFVTSIGKSPFCWCIGLTSIVIPILILSFIMAAKFYKKQKFDERYDS